jgi:energy-coupling factor transport system ATP-binding protein|tara:strand:- start:19 stop:2292 length:2274 start_codon:yes stop_codon:yes gene_type:complete
MGLDQKNKFGMGVLNPLPRFIFFVVLSLASTFFTYNWIGVAVSGVIVTIIYLLGRVYFKLGLITCTIAGLLSFIGNIFIHHSGNIILTVGPLTLTEGGLETGAILGLRLFFMILFAIAYISVTSLEDLFDTAKSLKLPHKGQIYLMIVLRYIDLLNKEFTTLQQSMAIRGIKWEGSVLDKIHGLRLIPVPMIFRLIGHINQQSLAVDNLGGTSTSNSFNNSQSSNKFEISKASVTYDLSKDVPKNNFVLKNINLQFNKGEKIMLIGENGSGKSSALILSRGLFSRTIGQHSGSINIFGKDTKDLTLGALSQIVRIVFPSAAHGLVGIRINDELELSLLRSKIDKSKWEEQKLKILKLVGLDESFLWRKTLSLSGGQQQRVAIASALIAEPELLLFDEVTGQLDPIGKEEVIESINRISSNQSTLLSEPNLNPLEFDKIYLVKDKTIKLIDKNDPDLIKILKDSGRRVPLLVELGSKYSSNKNFNNIEYYLNNLKELMFKNNNIKDYILPKREKSENLNQNIIRTEKICFSYDKKTNVLDNINLSIKKNELIAILGANGSGKSTLSLVLSYALKATKGKVIKDENIKIGYIFQEPSYQILSTSVREELAFGPKQLKFEKDQIDKIVLSESKRFDLKLNENPINLSPEDLRKLTIASILAIDTDIIIFDEPTNTLDENEIIKLMKIIEELKKLGKTIILITHDIHLAWNYAERLIIMKDGKIEIDGPTDSIMKEEEKLRECNITVPNIAKLYNKYLSFN